MSKDAYLGDGLYASFDGYQIRLYTERSNGTHEVFLENATLGRFEAFIAAVRESLRGAK